MNKKKLILSTIAGIAGVLVIAVVVFLLSLNSIVKSSVETVGPKMTLTPFELGHVEISPLSGHGSFGELLIGNPEGYTGDFAIKMDRALMHIRPSTLLSDKLVVETIQVHAPEITFEGGRLKNNLGTIMQNIAKYRGTERKDRPYRKLQVNHFRLTGAKVHLRLTLFGNQTITLTAPEIELRDLGTGPDGVTGVELTQLVVKRISSEIGTMMTEALAEMGRARSDARSE